MKTDEQYNEMLQLFCKAIDTLTKDKAILQTRLDRRSTSERQKINRPHHPVTGQFVKVAKK